MPTRRTVLAAVGAAVTGGCLAGPGRDPATETRTGTPPTGTWQTPGEGVPDPDHVVYLHNSGTRDRTVHLQVVRQETNELVFEATRTVAGGTERAVYNLREAEPAGVEAFQVCGRLVEPMPTRATGSTEDASETPAPASRDCATVRTNACYGSTHVSVSDEGGVTVIYSIC